MHQDARPPHERPPRPGVGHRHAAGGEGAAGDAAGRLGASQDGPRWPYGDLGASARQSPHDPSAYQAGADPRHDADAATGSPDDAAPGWSAYNPYAAFDAQSSQHGAYGAPPDGAATPERAGAAAGQPWSDVGSAQPQAPQRYAPAVTRQSRPSFARRMLTWTIGLAVLALIGGAMLVSQSGTSYRGAATMSNLGGDDRTWGYYHDRYYDSARRGPQWEQHREAVIDRGGSRWKYDGPYEYGTYGSQALKERAAGKASDPIYGGAAQPLPDVFEMYGNADPTGGDPVGDPALAWTDPTYNPYAGYSNPYANRIRMAWGAGSGRGELWGQ